MKCYPIATGLETIAAAGPITGTLALAGLSNLSTSYFDVTVATKRRL
jgi:hypothetical protein